MNCEVQGCCNSREKKEDGSSSTSDAPDVKYRFFRIPMQTVLKLNLTTCDQEDHSSDFAIVCNLHFKNYKLPSSASTGKVNIKIEAGAGSSTPIPISTIKLAQPQL